MKKFFTIYALTDCEFCKKSISLLDEKQIPFIVVVMDKNIDFMNKIKQDTKHTTVPIILFQTEQANKIIGGFDNLEEFLQSPEFIND